MHGLNKCRRTDYVAELTAGSTNLRELFSKMSFRTDLLKSACEGVTHIFNGAKAVFSALHFFRPVEYTLVLQRSENTASNGYLCHHRLPLDAKNWDADASHTCENFFEMQ